MLRKYRQIGNNSGNMGFVAHPSQGKTIQTDIIGNRAVGFITFVRTALINVWYRTGGNPAFSSAYELINSPIWPSPEFNNFSMKIALSDGFITFVPTQIIVINGNTNTWNIRPAYDMEVIYGSF